MLERKSNLIKVHPMRIFEAAGAVHILSDGAYSTVSIKAGSLRSKQTDAIASRYDRSHFISHRFRINQ